MPKKPLEEEVRWYQNHEYMAHAMSFRQGDFVFIRPELKTCHWYAAFIQNHGAGPFMIYKINNPHITGSLSVLLLSPDGELLTMPPIRAGFLGKNIPENPSTWIFGHLFVRNNFLGAVHKAITCNPSPSEP